MRGRTRCADALSAADRRPDDGAASVVASACEPRVVDAPDAQAPPC